MNGRSLVMAALAAVVGISVTAPAHAAPAQRLRFEQIETSTLRDAASDVVLSDGAGAYSTVELEASYVRNLSPSIVDSDVNTLNQDRLFVKTTAAPGARGMTLSSDLASTAAFGLGSTQPIDCVSTHILFESAATPDWWEALDSVGDTVRGWGNVRCYTTPKEDRGYQVFYNREASLTTGPGECLTITRTSRTTLVLDADSGLASPLGGTSPCVGSVQTFQYTTVGDERTFSASALGSESAPYEVTLEFPRSKGKGKS